MPHALGLGVGLHEAHALLGAAGQAQVVQGHLIDREDRGGGAELGAHVADGGAVGQRHLGDALSVELDKLSHHPVSAQHLGDGQDHVGGGGTGGDGAGELEAHDLGDEHGDGLAQHGGLGLDAAHTPAQDAQAVDHGGVGVGAHAGIGVGLGDAVGLVGEDDAGQVLDVDLVNDAGARRDDAEVGQCPLPPAQELVALGVALVLTLLVALQGAGQAEGVDLHGVVDDHLSGVEGVDDLGVAAEVGDRLTHGGQVDDAGHTREVLHDDAGRGELDLRVGLSGRVPGGQGAHVVSGDVGAVLSAQQVLGKHLEAVGQTLYAGDGVEAVDLVTAAVHVEDGAGVEGVEACQRRSCSAQGDGPPSARGVREPACPIRPRHTLDDAPSSRVNMPQSLKDPRQGTDRAAGPAAGAEPINVRSPAPIVGRGSALTQGQASSAPGAAHRNRPGP